MYVYKYIYITYTLNISFLAENLNCNITIINTLTTSSYGKFRVWRCFKLGVYIEHWSFTVWRCSEEKVPLVTYKTTSFHLICKDNWMLYTAKIVAIVVLTMGSLLLEMELLLNWYICILLNYYWKAHQSSSNDDVISCVWKNIFIHYISAIHTFLLLPYILKVLVGHVRGRAHNHVYSESDPSLKVTVKHKYHTCRWLSVLYTCILVLA